jgi:hypothetical protein
MRGKFAFIFLFTLLLLSVASASFSFSKDESSINNQYEVSGHLKAKINISFQNESVNSIFNDSLGNSIKLGTLLTAVSGYEYEYNDSTNKTVNSKFQILEFENANFSMPSTTGNFTYKLSFSGAELFKETIKIISADFEIARQIENNHAKLNNLKAEISKYDLFVQETINRSLNMTSLEANLNSIEYRYNKASSEEEYDEILTDLSNLDIPEGISEATATNSITFYPDRGIINLDILQSIGGGDYGTSEDEYIDAVYFWNVDNLKTRITFRELLITYESHADGKLNLFQFEFNKENITGPVYFIIEEISDLTFKEDYSQAKEAGYVYIDLNKISDKIIFSTTADVDFINVPAFVSPSLDNLSPIGVGDYTNSEDEKKMSKWMLFGLIIFLIILFGIVAYIVIQTWYRRKYENYLFKNRNNLYNIMTYIQTSKKKGMDREEIMKNLKKADWTREQINYALRKYEGKKIIGIIEKPFKKVIEDVDKKSLKKI